MCKYNIICLRNLTLWGIESVTVRRQKKNKKVLWFKNNHYSRKQFPNGVWIHPCRFKTINHNILQNLPMSSMRFEPYHRRPCIIILHRRSLIRDRSWASATDGVFNIIPGHMAYVIGSTWWFHILIIMV